MNNNKHYTAEQLTPEEAELKHIAEQARKYHMAECVSCKFAVESDAFFEPKCRLHKIMKPEEARVRQCPSFRPYNIAYTRDIIRLNKEREEAQMRKLTEESEKRHKEVFSRVRAMRVMARLVVHEAEKKLNKDLDE